MTQFSLLFEKNRFMSKFSVAIAVLLSTAILGACGPSESEVRSASAIDSHVRQLNAVCENIRVEAPNEGQLSRLELERKFQSDKEGIREIRQSLASADIINDYAEPRAALDTIISLENTLINNKTTYSISLWEGITSYRSYQENMVEVATEDYNRMDNMMDALDELQTFRSSKTETDSMASVLKDNLSTLKLKVEDYNSLLSDYEMNDSLRYCKPVGQPSEIFRDIKTRLDTLEVDLNADTEAVIDALR